MRNEVKVHSDGGSLSCLELVFKQPGRVTVVCGRTASGHSRARQPAARDPNPGRSLAGMPTQPPLARQSAEL